MSWTQRLLDHFTGVAFTDLASHTPDVGSGYTSVLHSWEIAASGTQAEPATPPALVFNNTVLENNQAAEVVLTNNKNMLLPARITGTTVLNWSGYRAVYNATTGQLQLFRLDNGSVTQLGSDVAQTFAANMVLRIECMGTEIRVLLNGVWKIVQTDATHNSGFVGLFTDDEPIIDDFAAYDSPLNLLSFTEQFNNGAWTQGGSITVTPNSAAAPSFANPKAGRADTLADNTVTEASSILNEATIADDLGDYVASVYIQKDAVTTRFPAFILALLGGGTPLTGGVSINTSTGTLADYSGGAAVASGIVDVDATWWRVWVRMTNNGTGNTTARWLFFPAQASSLGGGFDSTATGSSISWGANITNTRALQAYDPSPAYPPSKFNLARP